MHTGIINSSKISMLSNNSTSSTKIKDFSLLINNFYHSQKINFSESVVQQEQKISTSLHELLSLLNSTEISGEVDSKEEGGSIHKQTDLLMKLTSLLNINETDNDEIDFASLNMETDQFLTESFSKVENKLVEFFQGFQLDGTENDMFENTSLPDTIKALKIIEWLGKEEDHFSQQTKVEDTVKELSNFVQAIKEKTDKTVIQNDHLSDEQVQSNNGSFVSTSPKNIAPIFFKKYNHNVKSNIVIPFENTTSTSVPVNQVHEVQDQLVTEVVFASPTVNEQMIKDQSVQIYSQSENWAVENDGNVSDTIKSTISENIGNPDYISMEKVTGDKEKAVQLPTTAESVIGSHKNLIIPLLESENETLDRDAIYNRISRENNTSTNSIPILLDSVGSILSSDMDLSQTSQEDNNSLIEEEVRQQTNSTITFSQDETLIQKQPFLESDQNNHVEMSLLNSDKNENTDHIRNTFARIMATQTKNDDLNSTFANESNLKIAKAETNEITMQEQVEKEQMELPLKQRATSEFVMTSSSSKEATLTLPIFASKLAGSFTSSKENNLVKNSGNSTQLDTKESSVHSNKDIKTILTSFISKLNEQENTKDKPITVVNKLVNPIMVESLRKKAGENNTEEPSKIIQPLNNDIPDLETKSSITVGQLQTTASAKVETLVLATPTGAPIATDQIQEQVESILKNSSFTRIGDSQKMVIRLTPEHLGSLKIELIQNEGNLVAKIMTETAEAKEKLETHLSSLKHGLTSQNITVDKIEISYNPSQQDRLNKEQQQQQQENLPERKHKQSKEEEQQNETSFIDELLNQEI